MCVQYVLHKGWCCAISLTLGVIPPFYSGLEIQPWAFATVGLMGLGFLHSDDPIQGSVGLLIPRDILK